MSFIKKIKSTVKSFLGLDKGPCLNDLKAMGMKVGENFIYDAPSTRFDNSHCWLIEIGNNVTFGPGVYLLAHDASTKKELGYTKIGRVVINDYSFIGANSIVMPGVVVGENCIIGASSVVTKDVPDGCVYAGNPARFVCTTEEYYKKQRELLDVLPVYEKNYTLSQGITEEQKQQMVEDLKKHQNRGFVF